MSLRDEAKFVSVVETLQSVCTLCSPSKISSRARSCGLFQNIGYFQKVIPVSEKTFRQVCKQDLIFL